MVRVRVAVSCRVADSGLQSDASASNIRSHQDYMYARIRSVPQCERTFIDTVTDNIDITTHHYRTCRCSQPIEYRSVKLKVHGNSFLVTSSRGCCQHVTRKSNVSDKYATATCPQQVVRVVLVEFGERNTRTNRQHYTAADCRPTNQVSAQQAEWESRPNPRSNLARICACRTRMSRGCYEETAPVEFQLYSATWLTTQSAGRQLVYRLRVWSSHTALYTPSNVYQSITIRNTSRHAQILTWR